MLQDLTVGGTVELFILCGGINRDIFRGVGEPMHHMMRSPESTDDPILTDEVLETAPVTSAILSHPAVSGLVAYQ